MIYVAILNWNSPDDTIACLESVFRSDYHDYRVILCDNNSQDGSLERIKAWADAVPGTPGASTPPGPIRYRECSREEAERGGEPEDASLPLLLIQTGDNLGFAGGNNVALSYALARGNFSHVWLLNNDTVVEPDALSHLQRRMAEVPRAGMCGSTMPYYDKPSHIWAQGGGTFNRWLAKSGCIGHGRNSGMLLPTELVERRMGYVAGASMLVSREFLQTIGLLSEDYFLYYEEPDWAMRARGSFTMAYAAKSVVYHKVGISTGIMNRRVRGSKPTDCYIFRNALRFTRKFFPVALPLVFVRVCFNRLKGYCVDLIFSGGKR